MFKPELLCQQLAILLALVLLPVVLTAQKEFTGTPRLLNSVEQSQIQGVFEPGFEVFDFPAAGLNRFIKDNNGSAAFTFNLEGMKLQMKLEKNPIRSAGFQLVRTTPSGRIIEHPKEVNTYKGLIDGSPKQFVRFFVSNERFGGMMQYQGELLFIEPLKDYIDAEKFNQTFVMSNASAPPPEIECALDISPASTPVTARDDIPRYLELAVDVDYEFYDLNAQLNENTVMQMVGQWVNNIDGIYQQAFMMSIHLIYLHIWQTVNDPYSGDIRQHWDDFFNYWRVNKDCVSRDAVCLFSGKNLDAKGFVKFLGVGAVCGQGNPSPVACPDPQLGYAVVEVTGSSDPTITFAHELGHNLNARHVCECKIMQSGNNCGNNCNIREPVFSTTAQSQINNYLQGTSFVCNPDNQFEFLPNDRCLLTPPPTTGNFEFIVGPDLICVGDMGTFTMLNQNQNTTFTWHLGPGLILTSGSLNSNPITVSATADGPTYIDISYEFICEGPVTVRKSVHTGLPLSPGTPNVNVVNNVMNIGFFETSSADSYDFTYTVTAGNQTHTVSGNTTDPSVIVSIVPGECVLIVISSVNSCGNSPPFGPLGYIDFCYSPYGYAVMQPPDTSNPASIAEEAGDRLQTVSPIKREGFYDENGGFTNYESIKKFNTVTIFPNPANDKFHIALPLLPEFENTILTVFDLNGRVIFKDNHSASNGVKEIPTSDWNVGIYFLEINSGKEKSRFKILVQK